MTTSPMDLDRVLKAALSERANGGADGLLEEILRTAETTPQRRTHRGGPMSWRTVSVLAAAALLLAGLVAMLAILNAPDPPPIPYRNNGDIVVQGQGCELLALDPETADRRVLFGGLPDCYADNTNYEMAWDPRGERLAFSTVFGCGACTSPEAQAAIAGQAHGLFLLDPETGEAERAACQLECPTGFLTWSPNGDVLAVHGPEWIWLVAPEDGSLTELGTPPGTAGTVSKPAWSADGTQLAFIATEGDRNAIVLADGTGTTNQILFEADGESFETIGWAPDATAVVAASNEDDDRRPVGHGRAIRLIPLDGSEPTTLYTETDDATLLSPRFTPDGSAVLFVRLLPIPEADPAGFPSGAEILRVPVSGGSPEVIWQGGDEVSGMSNLAWSPDGRYVLFFATGSGLILMDMDSGAITRTAVHGGDAFIGTNFEASSPAWRPVP